MMILRCVKPLLTKKSEDTPNSNMSCAWMLHSCFATGSSGNPAVTVYFTLLTWKMTKLENVNIWLKKYWLK